MRTPSIYSKLWWTVSERQNAENGVPVPPGGLARRSVTGLPGAYLGHDDPRFPVPPAAAHPA